MRAEALNVIRLKPEMQRCRNWDRDFFFFFFFWSCLLACGILVPWLGIKPVPSALREWSLNHWTTREVPRPNKVVSSKLNCYFNQMPWLTKTLSWAFKEKCDKQWEESVPKLCVDVNTESFQSLHLFSCCHEFTVQVSSPLGKTW